MALNETNAEALLEATAQQGYQMELNVLRSAAMPLNPHQPAPGKNRSGLSGLMGGMKGDRRLAGGGFSIGAKVTSGKEKKKKTKKQPTPARIPHDKFSTAAANCPSAVETRNKKRRCSDAYVIV